jgi:penicillin-binding protein-related factor A (putative recombinase)
MAINKGKVWEDKFRQDWRRCFPNSFMFRLKDQMTGYKETSGNPCDFLCFPGNGELFLIECKEHKGASIPFTAIPQYDRLLEYQGLPGIRAGVVLWLSEKDRVFWISIDEMEKMVNDGKKSIGLKMFEDKSYNIIEIPSVKKRVYLDSDYTILTDGGIGDKNG